MLKVPGQHNLAGAILERSCKKQKPQCWGLGKLGAARHLSRQTACEAPRPCTRGSACHRQTRSLLLAAGRMRIRNVSRGSWRPCSPGPHRSKPACHGPRSAPLMPKPSHRSWAPDQAFRTDPQVEIRKSRTFVSAGVPGIEEVGLPQASPRKVSPSQGPPSGSAAMAQSMTAATNPKPTGWPRSLRGLGLRVSGLAA